MIKRKNAVARKRNAKKTVKSLRISQADMVLDYLVGAGRKGATNFEMMMHLRICDVRKRISELNNSVGLEYSFESKFETSNDGKTYKRYYAVPIEYFGNLEDYLNETKSAGKSRQKSISRRRG